MDNNIHPRTMQVVRADARTKAHRDAKENDRSETVRRILARHAEKCETRLIGKFEEPGWWVPPQPAPGKQA